MTPRKKQRQSERRLAALFDRDQPLEAPVAHDRRRGLIVLPPKAPAKK